MLTHRLQVLAYATLVVLLMGLEISWRLDDRRPGVISLHSKLGLLRYMHRSIVSSEGCSALFSRLTPPRHFKAYRKVRPAATGCAQDLSDQEWQLLRRLSLPLTVVLALFVVCSRLVRSAVVVALDLWPSSASIHTRTISKTPAPVQVASFWPRYRTAFYVAAGLAFTGGAFLSIIEL